MNIENKNLSDSQVVALVLEGDSDSYALIMERYESKLMRYALFILRDYDSASDVTQETFIKAYVNLRSFKLNKRFSSWIYRILHNEAINSIRKSKKTCALEAVSEVGDDFFVNFTADHILDKNILNTDVRKCLRKIDIKYQEVLALNFFDNLKYGEISDILHVPTSTVGVRIKRGKAMLRKICQNSGVHYE